jgi:hypothetical protein
MLIGTVLGSGGFIAKRRLKKQPFSVWQIFVDLLPNRVHLLPSGGGCASKASTVWRQVATAGNAKLLLRIVAIRCQAVVGVRVRPPPSGDRWLRLGTRIVCCRIVAIRCQAVVGGE